MHEFEQGVWKNLFTHLVRILHALDPALVIEMDKRYSLLIRLVQFLTENCCRYRQVSRFGSDVIRKFSSNSSEQKKMAARDFEDLLQVSTIFYIHNKLKVVSSVQSLFLMVSSRIHTMIQFKSCYSLAHTGMDLRSFACTLTIHYRSSKKLRQNWEINFDSLLMKLVRLIARLNFLARLRLDCGAKPRTRRVLLQIQRKPVVALVGKRPSI
jgi:hypothetical protein